MSTTVTNTTMGTSGEISRTEHSISWTGLAGAILWVSLAGLFILVIGYATTGWYTTKLISGKRELGLWESCTCSDHSNVPDFVKSTQAFASLGMIMLVASTALALCYMLLHFLPKKLLLIATFASFIAGAVFLLIAVAVYGAESSRLFVNGHQSYSFAFAVIANIFCIAGAAVTFLQMRKSGTC